MSKRDKHYWELTEEQKERKRAYMRKWAKENRDKASASERRWRRKHYDKYIQTNRIWRAKNAKRLSQMALVRFQKSRLDALIHYGGNPPKCECCNEWHYQFLSIDHIDGGGRKHLASLPKNYGKSGLYRWLKDTGWPKGFRVLCMNCNFARSWGRICPHDLERLSRN